MGSPTSITLDRLCSRELFAAHPRINITTQQLISLCSCDQQWAVFVHQICDKICQHLHCGFLHKDVGAVMVVAHYYSRPSQPHHIEKPIHLRQVRWCIKSARDYRDHWFNCAIVYTVKWYDRCVAAH